MQQLSCKIANLSRFENKLLYTTALILLFRQIALTQSKHQLQDGITVTILPLLHTQRF